MSTDALHDAAPAGRLPRAVRRFFETEAAGGVVLLAAAVVALVWANSPWRGGYEALWSTYLTVDVGGFGITEDLRHWVNDALMAIFFFVVGLEIKRELVSGELRSPRQAAFPALAALGGMIVPAVMFLALNPSGPGARGWGIPMATDIAFALGVAAVLGRRVSTSLKLFLLTLAIVDDIGAILVIAVFYTASLSWTALLVAAGLLALMVVLRTVKVGWMPAYFLLGVAVWVAVFKSGVHATIAGVVLGLAAPARPLTPGNVAREWAESLSDDPTPHDTAEMTKLARGTVSVAERLQHSLHPVSSFFIVPVFALANAGVALEARAITGADGTRVAIGVVLGLVLGKIVGVLGGAWLAVRTGAGLLPRDVGWSQLSGAAALAGIGFTVSLFITDLAFQDAQLQAAAKIGILVASVLASLLGAAILVFSPAGRTSPRGSAPSAPSPTATHP